MNKQSLFLVLFIISVGASFTLFIVLQAFGYGMGELMQYDYSGRYIPMFLIMSLFLALFLIAVFGIAGLAYSISSSGEKNAVSGLTPIYASLMPDERKVIDCLKKHKGRCLQKDISKETGFSRLKTHRLVSRLQQRKILVVTPAGKTNQVALAPWISEGKYESD